MAAFPTSDHFLLEAVADGIYAAIATPGKGAQGNAAIIDLGDQTVILDTMLTPHAARDLRTAAETLTGRKTTLVVNSHWHGDHIQGNQVFADDTSILATTTTRDIMATRGATALASIVRDIAQELAQAEAQLAETEDPVQCATLVQQVSESRELALAAPELRLCLPTDVFTERRVIQGSRRAVEVITLGGGHTASDAFLWLPDDAIIVTGDLLFVQSHPWLGHGDPDEWTRILTQMERFPAQRLIPGHGPLGTLADCAQVRAYIVAIQQLVADSIQTGMTLEAAKTVTMPAPFDTWADAYVAAWNIEFLWNRMAPAEKR